MTGRDKHLLVYPDKIMNKEMRKTESLSWNSKNISLEADKENNKRVSLTEYRI